MRPTSALIDLQREAMNEHASLVAVMGKAYDYAVENELHELEAWLHNELNGYPETTITPWYRRLSGTLLAELPFSGWHPIDGDDFKRYATTFTCRLPISEIVTHHECNQPIRLRFTSDESAFLSEMMGPHSGHFLYINSQTLRSVTNHLKASLRVTLASY
ncbi:hypothetical protein [Salinivibrio kushneri]|uniref:AbiTii domain-containing protein n=1 Tax=Salinivibrio kushneri TaxID=1908198 RepID=UPI0009861DBF|nr:hypothetical protein [Salinivibrio kushneri]OOE61080.1 hypothetical protein BZG18_10125 [Salinivibrio kushneri]